MNMETKHTPGPWITHAVYGRDGYHVEILGDRMPASFAVVADMPIAYHKLPDGPDATWDHQMANACLIAAAPDLLDALRAISAFAEHVLLTEMEDTKNWSLLPYPPMEKARAAIAKATGENG